MFDLGFSELIVIALVALVVIGPERLPKVARTVGLLLGRLQRYVSDVKSEINREMQLDELKKLGQDVQTSAQELEQSVRKEMSSAQQEVDAAVRQAQTPVAEKTDAAAAASAPTPVLGGAETPVEAVPGPQLDLGLDAREHDKVGEGKPQ